MLVARTPPFQSPIFFDVLNLGTEMAKSVLNFRTLSVFSLYIENEDSLNIGIRILNAERQNKSWLNY